MIEKPTRRTVVAAAICSCFLIAAVTHAGQSTSPCSMETPALLSMQTQQVSLISDGPPLHMEVRLADDRMEQSGGFQHLCPEVIQNTLILFVFAREIRSAFHMRNVHSSLDIAFFDASGKLLQIEKMAPYTAQNQGHLTTAGNPFMYALEARAGYFQEHGLVPGSSRLVIHN